ncbi:hypothetical protein EYF80_008254 [Liparis tanakae]|uniref:Uncharacterized protein n=1 Tax=Liparis tanakae TaxID=230148 RepID=A0A4Z2IW38_9TELE|nr:hypothetical protein EYF80_008254 [Liparis tanakae]
MELLREADGSMCFSSASTSWLFSAFGSSKDSRAELNTATGDTPGGKLRKSKRKNKYFFSFFFLTVYWKRVSI